MMAEIPKLKPCPFCGNDKWHAEDNSVGSYWIVCEDGCGCEGPYRQSEPEAIKAWNVRHEEGLWRFWNHKAREQAVEIDLLRQAVVRYCDHSRMGTVEPMSVQQAIDDAFAHSSAPSQPTNIKPSKKGVTEETE